MLFTHIFGSHFRSIANVQTLWFQKLWSRLALSQFKSSMIVNFLRTFSTLQKKNVGGIGCWNLFVHWNAKLCEIQWKGIYTYIYVLDKHICGLYYVFEWIPKYISKAHSFIAFPKQMKQIKQNNMGTLLLSLCMNFVFKLIIFWLVVSSTRYTINVKNIQ